MNFVQPIRDKETVQDIAEYLKFKNERNYIMWMMGIYSGLRISDILRLRIRDVYNKQSITIREKKTGKQKTFLINRVLKRALAKYCEGKGMDEYLIKSREKTNQPITRSMAYKILQDAANQFGLENIGTHTMRKTFGYFHYLQFKDLVTLMRIFNHSNQRITLIYIGIEQETIDKTINDFRIF